ncbi:MAG: TOBE domain-containing protein [Methylococcales bacterium]|nr:TOBE domain-containing protein [Methylococcales bacterium]
MPKHVKDINTINWVQGELRLAGSLDNRMIGLLKAIHESGSINQAAKNAGLSYKGAWQMIERANNLAPKVLVSTATGGSKGGGTVLTAAGLALLQLFTELEQQHRQFLQQLNHRLADDPTMQLLLKRLVIKTSASNQLFGSIAAIHGGAVNAEVSVALKGGEQVIASLALTELGALSLSVGDDVVLLINDPEMIVITEASDVSLSARNSLSGKVIRLQSDGVDSAVVIQLPSGETLIATITQASADALALTVGLPVRAVFKSNAVIVGVMPHQEAGVQRL